MAHRRNEGRAFAARHRLEPAAVTYPSRCAKLRHRSTVRSARCRRAGTGGRSAARCVSGAAAAAACGAPGTAGGGAAARGPPLVPELPEPPDESSEACWQPDFTWACCSGERVPIFLISSGERKVLPLLSVKNASPIAPDQPLGMPDPPVEPVPCCRRPNYCHRSNCRSIPFHRCWFRFVHRRWRPCRS